MSVRQTRPDICELRLRHDDRSATAHTRRQRHRGAAAPQQRVIKARRDDDAWVASESLKDWALRFTPRSYHRWSPGCAANTALGDVASFLVLEALGEAPGGTLLPQYGFINTFWAILATAAIIFAAGLPVCPSARQRDCRVP